MRTEQFKTLNVSDQRLKRPSFTEFSCFRGFSPDRKVEVIYIHQGAV